MPNFLYVFCGFLLVLSSCSLEHFQISEQPVQLAGIQGSLAPEKNVFQVDHRPTRSLMRMPLYPERYQFCGQKHVFTRPELRVGRTYSVGDINSDGTIDGEDIQKVIDLAHADHEEDLSYHFYSVRLRANTAYQLKKTLVLRSGVLLEGPNQPSLHSMARLEIRDVPERLSTAVEFAPKTVRSGVMGLFLATNGQVKTSGIRVHDSRAISILNNVFVEAPRLHEQSLARSFVLIDGNSKDIHVHGNSLNKVGAGISVVGTGSRRITIENNLIRDWSRFAIRVFGDLVEADEVPLREIVVRGNRVEEPHPLARTKKPIVAQTTIPIDRRSEAVSRMVSDILVSRNAVFSVARPYRFKFFSDGSRIPIQNQATADAISFHTVKDSQIVGNCLKGNGEVGITVSVGARNVRVIGNDIRNNNGPGIYVGHGLGSSKEHSHLFPRTVIVQRNLLKDVNRDWSGKGRKSNGKWALSGIVVFRAHRVALRGNTLEDSFVTRSLPKTLFGLYIWRASTDERADRNNNFRLHPSSLEIFYRD